MLFFYIVCYTAVAWAATTELRRQLMMFQQNSYRPGRYRNWLKASAESTSFWRLGALVIFFFSFARFTPHAGAEFLAGIFGLAMAWVFSRRKYKKPLVLTPRAKRLLYTAFALAVLVAIAAWLIWGRGSATDAFYAATVAVIAVICLSPLFILAADWLMKPVENSINRKFYNAAAQRLASMPDLRIIGVTGSYGKTTTKHYITTLLSEQFSTLMTPGSYNTTLGVVRTVNEYLKAYHEIFVVEMGAKQKGDIKEICDLVHPHMGVVTAVGPQHLESFKTIENVQATKFELIDALPSDGLAVVNNDFPMIASRPVDNVKCTRYAVKDAGDSDVEYFASDIRYTPAGTTFNVSRRSDGWTLELQTHLVGECNISNIVAAVAVAKAFGMSDDKIRYGVARLKQVEHRLSIRNIPGGLTIIDDAFNSNPVGSAMALDVLAAMPGKRILITPGMIELGEQQFDLNQDFGKKAASCCDIAIVVGQYNREAIVAGLEQGGMPAEAIRKAESFNHAQEILHSTAAPGDAVLYENDLPDTFK